MKKQVLVLIVLTSLLMVVSVLIFNTYKLQIPIITDVSTLVSTNIQLIKQRVDGELRKNNPPTADQIIQMQNQANLCFVDDDCRYDAKTLMDCNMGLRNKYYQCKKDISVDTACLNTAIGCPKNYYAICNNNRCEKKHILGNY